MKQTVGILSALIVALLALSAFILSTNLQQSQLLTQSSEVLIRLQTERDELLQSQKTLKAEKEKLDASLQTVTAERDALSLQLNDAVLASQLAGEAASLQADQAAALELHISRLTKRNQELEAALANPAPSPTPSPTPAPVLFPFTTFSPLVTLPPQ